MKKTDLIKEKLISLLEENSLNDITVLKLCKECGINRQIFYYHYKDISDVLVDFFLNEEIPGANKATTWENLIHTILMYAKSHRQLILKTLKSKSSRAVESFFYDNLYNNGKKILEKQYGNQLSKKDISEVANLICDSLSREISRLLINPLELSMSNIEENISKTFEGVLDLICSNKKKKGKI